MANIQIFRKNNNKNQNFKADIQICRKNKIKNHDFKEETESGKDK